MNTEIDRLLDHLIALCAKNILSYETDPAEAIVMCVGSIIANLAIGERLDE